MLLAAPLALSFIRIQQWYHKHHKGFVSAMCLVMNLSCEVMSSLSTITIGFVRTAEDLELFISIFICYFSRFFCCPFSRAESAETATLSIHLKCPSLDSFVIKRIWVLIKSSDVSHVLTTIKYTCHS